MTEANVPTTVEIVWSPEQGLILQEFEHGTENFVVIARAGTGKTTVGVAGAKLITQGRTLYCAFNKKNAEELETRFKGTQVVAKTFHSLGAGICFRYWDGISIDFSGAREKEITAAVCGPEVPDAVRYIVTKLHTKARELAPHAREFGELTDLAIQFECEPDDQWVEAGFDAAFVEQRALAALKFASETKSRRIDGADMIFLPLRNGWVKPAFNTICVDEYQDLNPPMLEMARKLLKPGGRLVLIGDDRQALYAFRGADSEVANRLRREMNAKELKMTQTRRCGQVIVARAQELVPDITAHPSNPEGLIRSLALEKLTEEAGASDFILSRLNAPLVGIAMRLLRMGKRTRIAGRDIGKGLVTLVNKLKARSVPDFLGKVQAWQQREEVRLKTQYSDKLDSDAYKTRIANIGDQAEMLASLADGAKNVKEVTDRIVALFTDDGTGDEGMIVCSSVHKAKGMEANRVFVLQGTLRDWNEEELNIQYVAITRARRELVWVA